MTSQQIPPVLQKNIRTPPLTGSEMATGVDEMIWDDLNADNYAQQLVEKVVPLCQSRINALDIGCATGRANFE